MAVITKVLVQGKILNIAGPEIQYSATGVTTIIDKFTARNYGTSPETLEVYLTDNGFGLMALVVKRTLAAGETYTFPEVVGHVLQASGQIVTVVSTLDRIAVRSSGREIN